MQRSAKIPAMGCTFVLLIAGIFVSGSRYALISANAPLSRQIYSLQYTETSSLSSLAVQRIVSCVISTM